MKILFVDEKDWVKKVPYTIHYLAEHLVKRGHEVVAIDFDDTWSKEDAFDLLAPYKRHLVAKLQPDCAVEVISPRFIKMPLISRLSTLVTHSWQINQLLREEAFDCIVTYAISNAFQTLYLGRKYNIPVFFHSIDMLGPLVPNPLLAKPAEMIEWLLMRSCDGVLALTPTFAARAERLGAKQVAVIPNGVNLERLQPNLDTSQLRAELGLGSEKVILFVGTFTKHVGLDHFLHHFAKMERNGVKFVVVGDDIVTAGREMRHLKAICRELKIEDDVIFTGLQPAQKVPLYINLADLCVSPFPPSKFSKYNIAMKVFEYMACGKPTLTFQLEGTKSLVPPNVGGVIYVDSHEEMFRAIAHLLQNEEECAALGEAGRRLVEEKFSWERVTANLENVLFAQCAQREDEKRQKTYSVTRV